MSQQQPFETTPAETGEQVTVYVYEEGSGELLYAVYEADGIPIPDVGDRFSFVHAETRGNLSDRSVEYTETADSQTFVVVSREFVYLHVDHELEDHDQTDQLITEVHLMVTAEGGTTPDRTWEQ